MKKISKFDFKKGRIGEDYVALEELSDRVYLLQLKIEEIIDHLNKEGADEKDYPGCNTDLSGGCFHSAWFYSV